MRLYDALSDASKAMLPEDLTAEASELKSIMTAVLEYHVGEFDGVAAKLADIRAGRSYNDLANDLSRLSLMYEAHGDVIRTDPKHFNPGQVKEARRLADAIRATLTQSSNTEVEQWRDMQGRAFKLLRDTYESVRAAATFLFGGDSALVAQMPSLYSAPRRRGRQQPAADAEVSDTSDVDVVGNGNGNDDHTIGDGREIEVRKAPPPNGPAGAPQVRPRRREPSAGPRGGT